MQSGGPEFDVRPDCKLDLFLIVQSATSLSLVNSQLVCLPPVGILNIVMFIFRCLFLSSFVAHNINYLVTSNGVTL